MMARGFPSPCRLTMRCSEPGVSGTWVKGDRTPDERTRTYIMVNVIADTLKRIKAAGGWVLTPRTDIGSGMGAFAVFADPVANEFGLYEEPRP